MNTFPYYIEKMKSRFNFTKIILVISIIFLSCMVYYTLKTRKTQFAEINLEEQYKIRFVTTCYAIAFNMKIAEGLTEMISEIWWEAIELGEDFSEEIGEMLNYLRTDNIVTIFRQENSEIEKEMKFLKKYSSQNKEGYEALFGVYLIYSQIYNLALKPKGSLISYRSKVTDLGSEYIKSWSKLKLFLPEEKEKVKETKKYNLNFKNKDIKLVLDNLSRLYNVEIVPGPGVEGAINIELEKVDCQTALDEITEQSVYRYWISNSSIFLYKSPKTSQFIETSSYLFGYQEGLKSGERGIVYDSDDAWERNRPLFELKGMFLPRHIERIAMKAFLEGYRFGFYRKECMENLKNLMYAMEAWAIAENKQDHDAVTINDLYPKYIEYIPKCRFGGDYIFEKVGDIPESTAYGKLEELGNVKRALKAKRDEKQRLDKLKKSLHQTVKLYKEGDEKGAIETYTEARDLDSGLHPNAYVYIGNIYDSSKRYKEALVVYKKAFEQNKKEFIIPYKIAELSELQDDKENAITFYKVALTINPDRGDLYDKIVSLYLSQGKSDDAISSYKEAIEKNPWHIYFYIKLANLFCSLDKHGDAIATYKTAIKNNLQNKQLYEALGALYSSLGKYDDAIAIYNNALKVFEREEKASLYNNLGNCYYLKHEYREATHKYKDALYWDSKNSEYYFNLGRAHVKEGWFEKATWALKLAINYGKKDAEVYYYLGEAYYGERRFKKAEESFKQALKLTEDTEFKNRIEEALKEMPKYN